MLVQKTDVLEDRLSAWIHHLGWERPTPIQQKGFPVVIRKKTSLLVAPTGSGKTEAAVIPVFSILEAEPKTFKGIRALYVTPLRALNRDILRRILSYAERARLSAEVRHGDTPTSVRRRQLLKPPDVLITTPETLSIILTSRKLVDYLRPLEWVIVDEVHELIGNERGAHLAASLERLASASEKEIVRVGLSATVGDLEEAAKFLAGGERKCAIIVDNSVREYNVSCRYIEGSLADVASSLLSDVRQVSGPSQKTILVFTNTRDEAEHLGAILKAKSDGIPVDVHHGSLSRETREDTETKLREGGTGIVVSTSSLELGLDIGSVNYVVQYGSPRQAVKLVQRVGRSRHKLGESATGAILTNRADEELESLALIERVRKHSLETTPIHFGALDVIAHQAVGVVLERNSVSTTEIVSLLKNAYPFRNLTKESVDGCFRLLERQGIVRYDGERAKRRGPKTYQFYFDNVSTIPDIQQFEVIDVTKKKVVGRLDQMFVGEYGEPGKPFVLKGSSWKIISIDDEKKAVHVEPLFTDLTQIPYWIGELIPVAFETAQIVGRLRRDVVSGKLQASGKQLNRLTETREVLGLLPDESRIIVEQKRGTSTVVVHCCFGTKVNQTLATILSTMLSSKIGFLVEARSDPYRVVLSTNGRLNIDGIETVLRENFNIENILAASVIGTHPLNWKTWYVAKKFGVIEKGAQYDRRAAKLIQDRYFGTPLHEEVLRELFLEKYDIPNVSRILESIRSGLIPIHARVVDDFSPLAKPILEYASTFAALPLTMEKTIIDLVRARLSNTKHKLLCMSCGRWESIVRTKDVSEPITCPICRSRLITETYQSDQELQEIIRRKISGKELTEDKNKKYRKAWKNSSLIQNFGRKALIVLSGFGIGPDTAARVLRSTTDEEEMYRGIYRAEKNYVATRGFWQD
jgi:ATP-dependent Lhr-like helicase